MFTVVMPCLTLRISVLLTAIFVMNIFTKEFSDSSSCEVTYREGKKFPSGSVIQKIYCNKTEDSLSDLYRTHHVYRYMCDGAEVVYQNCSNETGSYDFEINDCALTPDTFDFCTYYEILRYRKIPGNYKNVVLRNGTFRNHHEVEQIILSGNGIQTVESGAFGCITYLWRLNMSNNDIEELPDDAFRCLPKLEYINLSHNRISVVTKCLRDLSSLTSLDLSDNLITVFPETALHKNARLDTLNLDRNAIKNFFPAEISQLDDLEILTLRGNNITSITRKCFAKQKKLWKLDIGMNIGLVLSNDSFAGLDNLTLLYIDGCGLSIGAEESAMFSDTTGLHTLHLQHNRLREIHSDLFQDLSDLSNLDLSFNAIAVLHNGSFANNRILSYLNLSNNVLSEIKSGQFSRMYVLNSLSISNNHIMNVAENAFYYLSRLRTLNISNNNISQISLQFSFPNVLDISFNRFTAIPWTNFSSIGNLWASNNNIQELFLPYIESSKIHTVHLEDCQIQKVRLHPKLQMKNGIDFWKTQIFLARNPVVCDCHAFQLYGYVKHSSVNRRFYFEGLTCRQPIELEGREVKNLLPGDFSCEVTRYCPQTCRCLKRALDNSLVVNCSRKDLGRLPEGVPANPTVLDVSYNRITSLESLNGSIWENLTEIHAEGNFISSLEFDIPKSVKIFLLHDNRLTKLPEMQTAVIRRALQITLSENPWSCGCESLELKYFLSKPVGQIPDASEVRCAPTTNSTSNLTLLEMKDQDLCPKSEKVSLKVVILISMVAVLSVLVFGLSVWLFYNKNENLVKAVLFTRCPCLFRLPGCRKVDEEDKTFDCFISYGSEDVNVPLAIVSAMGEDPNPEFQFCVHDRQWRGGSTISDNIFRSVELSRKTLIVISQTFVKNKWFHLEFQAALMQMLKDRRDRMIFVIKGELPDYEDLPRDVSHFLRTRTYLVWGERWFMEKLRYSLQEESVPFRVQLREFLLVVGNCFRNRRLYHRDRPEEVV